MFKRKIYDRIMDWKEAKGQRCLMIEGARQVGKTFIVRQIGKGYGRFVELNFEDQPLFKDIFADGLDSGTIIARIKNTFGQDSIVKGDTLLFLDEIQSCPRAWTALKALAQTDDIDVIASGSFLGRLYSEDAFSPGGYVETIGMTSMDFEEFCWANGISESTLDDVRRKIRNRSEFDDYELKLMETLHRSYILTGGMPAAVSALVETRDFDEVRKRTIEIRNIYRNDVSKYAVPKHRDEVYRIFDNIPEQLAKENNRFLFSDIPSSLDEPTDVAHNPARSSTYRPAIEWLIDAGICISCNQVKETTLPLIGDGRMFKLYMCDTGILASMIARDSVIPAFTTTDHPSNRGYIMENCIADLLQKAGLEVLYYRKKSTEVDFITSLDGTVTGIEVKSGNNNQSKSLDSLMKDGRIQRGIKFETCNTHVDGRGIEHYPRFVSGFMDCLYERKHHTMELPVRASPSGNDG